MHCALIEYHSFHYVIDVFLHILLVVRLFSYFTDVLLIVLCVQCILTPICLTFTPMLCLRPCLNRKEKA
jgi:hypothetical protein